MAPKKAQTKKKAGGGKLPAVKPSAAPTKKPATNKAAAAPVRAVDTRRQPGRRVRGDGDDGAPDQNRLPPSPPRGVRKKAPKMASISAEDEDVDDVVRPPSRKTRTCKRPATDVTDDADDAPPAKRTKKGRGPKAPAPSGDEDDDDIAPAPSQGTRTGRRPSADDIDSLDDVPLAERRRGARRSQAAAPRDEDDDQDEEAEQQDTEIIDDATNNPDIDIDLGDIIARAELPGIALRPRNENTDVTLRFLLEVYPDPWKTKSRLFYRLRFYLTRANEAEQEAGYIHAHRIAKSTAAHPHADTRTWPTELPHQNPDTMQDGSIKETTLCLLALFNQTGNPNGNKIKNAALRTSLADNPLIFIEMIHIRHPFQRRGLLASVLDNWQGLLQRGLPGWCVFRGSVVLVPGMPDSEVGRRGWGDEDEGAVEERLTGVYEGCGFEVWVRSAKRGGERC